MVLTGAASYTNGFRVLLSVRLKRQHYYICCPPSSWHSTDVQFVSFASMFTSYIVWVFHGYYYIFGYGASR